MIKNDRLHELDSLRGLAALGVVCWHYTSMWRVTPLNGIFAPFYSHGLLMVDFFFVLSGFVLARAYWNERRRQAIGQNFLERVARIYPLHLVMLLAVVPIEFFLQQRLGPLDYLFKYSDKYHFILNIFLLNYSSLERGFSFNAPAWSISTEIIINAMFFAIITLNRKAATILMAIAWGMAATVIAKHGLITSEGAFGLNSGIYRTIAGFFLGVGLFKSLETRLSDRQTGNVLCDAIFLLSIAALLAFMVRWPTDHINVAVFAAAIFPTIIATAVFGRFSRKALATRPLTFLGEISYSIYLTHFVLLLLTMLVQALLKTQFHFENPAILIGFLSVTVLASTLTYHFVEMPGKVVIQRLAGRWIGSSAARQS
ncbi:acyltransferase [Burkholderia multivorans]|uniref:acyltransferase family protein n=1 Tax=Burkholderia multivorans TaxID=87883 RepID=UPI0020A0366A|nr:acyltransferase [Burkholderia multivorans]MCO8609742.1 acyltransferase [Burkholderia multivorans]MCO8638367.1 acyltransferase [Burkholderia multivorans]MCO8644591.1 acyltransferase [Burkholderia multivorans]